MAHRGVAWPRARGQGREEGRLCVKKDQVELCGVGPPPCLRAGGTKETWHGLLCASTKQAGEEASFLNDINASICNQLVLHSKSFVCHADITAPPPIYSKRHIIKHNSVVLIPPQFLKSCSG